MSLHAKPHLNAARRRARKRTLARRDGAHCAYCRIPFMDLREATMDHVVPISLFLTWSADHLVLACRPCNTAKADRLPLSLALVLCATFAPTGVNTASTPVDGTVDAADITSTPVEPTVTPVDRDRDALAMWRLLVRLAADHEKALTCVPDRVTPGVTGATPDCDARRTADPIGERSTPSLQRSTRPECLRAPRPERACSGPTGSVVCA